MSSSRTRPSSTRRPPARPSPKSRQSDHHRGDMNTRAGPTPSDRPFASLTSTKTSDAVITTTNVAQHKTTFKALRRVSLDPGRITQIAAAALVLLQLEYDRTI